MPSHRTRYCIPFEECRLGDTAVVGGKNANLGELIHAKINVPRGFAVTAQAYEHFLEMTGTGDSIRRLMDETSDFSEMRKCEALSAKIADMIHKPTLPDEIGETIRKGYQDLALMAGVSPLYVAVRSSGTTEDLAEASLAGQHDTFLFVKDQEEVVKKVITCWSSTFTPRAILYREKMKIPLSDTLMSVGVQTMVDAFSAGVMFTLDPVTGDNSVVVMNANFGLGESVVSGEVTPDHYVVDKIDGDIIEKNISSKDIKYIHDYQGKGLTRVETEAEEKKRPALLEEEIRSLAEIGKKIESYYRRTMDIEWAIEKEDPSACGTIYILQARPETVWQMRKDKTEEPYKGVVNVLLNGFLK